MCVFVRRSAATFYTRTVLGLWVALATACGDDTQADGETQPDDTPSRCAAPPRPRTDAVVALARAFPNVSIDDGVALMQLPSGRWYAIAKSGVVYTFADDPDAEASVFLDISGQIVDGSEAGLLGIAFHPSFPDDPRVFLHYNAALADDDASGPFASRISSFIAERDGLTASASSEVRVLDVPQPYSNHNGGDIGFGPDGFLYFALGDGGSAGDPLGSGQDTQTLLGSMLRLDVDGAAPYQIPTDNPFAQGGGRPEIFAWGFRNPYRWSFDPATGELWVGDVGQHTWEEVNLVSVGGNYGWATREGTDCLSADTCTVDGLSPPVVQYRNTGDASVVAGEVYGGDAVDDLSGVFIYSDFYFGTIFGITAAGGEPRVLGEGARGIGGWARNNEGELFGIDYFDGSIYALEAVDIPPPGPDPFPRSILETGCVALGDVRAPVSSTVRYAVNLPFWSDGAQKERFIAMPEGASAAVGPGGDLELPVGTVLVKTFLDGDRPIETRLLVHHEDGGWAGYGYAWNETGTDATYVEQTVTKSLGDRSWVFPSTRDCEACHTQAAGDSLGLELAQLTAADQQAWTERGWLVDPPTVASLDVADARDYLHVNCSSCHRDEGTGGRANLDLRRDVPLEDTGLCGSPRAGDLGLEGARIVDPGNPATSVLAARMQAEASARMPPLGSTMPDTDGVALIEAWIESLTSCP